MSTTKHRFRLAAATTMATVACLSVTGLAACGSATVDNGASQTSETSLPRASQKASPSSTTSTAPSRGGKSAPQPKDETAREVDKAPTTQNDRTPKDQEFLKTLSEQGITVDGVEDTLIGTAEAVCADDPSQVQSVTVPAVAGQLVTQGRTKKSAEELESTLRDVSKDVYCK